MRAVGGQGEASRASLALLIVIKLRAIANSIDALAYGRVEDDIKELIPHELEMEEEMLMEGGFVELSDVEVLIDLESGFARLASHGRAIEQALGGGRRRSIA